MKQLTRLSKLTKPRTRTQPHPKAYRAATAVLLAGGLLLTGCSAGDAADSNKSAERSAIGGGPGADGGPGSGPGTAGPADRAEEGGGQPDGEEKKRDTADEGEFAPEPDYLSTFALDVDTASYGYALRTLGEGRLPDPATVRPEEFVNSFRQDYEPPEGDGFSVTVDGAAAPGADDDWSLLRVGLATRPADHAGQRPPAALTFVIDISGSMAEPGRLDLVKQSLGILTDELRGDDSIALVTFSEEAETRLPMTRVGDSRARIRDVISELAPARSTNVGAGVETGYAEAVDGLRKGATNRVVLLSDALANTGETEADVILEHVAEAREEHGITLFGVGVGSDYGDALMEQLADKGDGHTTYVSNRKQARKVFVDQLPMSLDLRARDAKAQVAFDRDTVERFRLIGYENRAVADEDFRNDGVDGGEVGPGHTVTALYAVKLRPGASGQVAKATVRWLDPGTRAPRERSGSVGASAVDGRLWGDAKPRLQVTAVAAYFAEALRGGRAPGDDGDARESALPTAPGLGELEERARVLADATEDRSVADLAEAIDRADRARD
ncbi:von Willebrand factor type A domain-containing protein [Streptomyces sp. NBC_01498]|uniref:vWA domain-containing protein n=1 Tax=Streptomyces sp. NBC_01498 TaxID=2975870 RepID=UPI002E7AC166|nr:von Willebrand factor type A domain-containing protein [Streptomyces sp. NBC_01498]WTL26837.1 von Willebrand factor type A domain-containing protein [Streptomyces sp. NBC_01498]